MGYPKKHRGRRKMGSKKEEPVKETNENKNLSGEDQSN